MKTKICIALIVSICAMGYTQDLKKSLKSASKSLKSGKIEAASQVLDASQGMLENAPDKLKAQFYYLKGKTSQAAGNNQSLEKIKEATQAFNQSIAIEKKAKTAKYAKDASLQLQNIRKALIDAAIKDQNAKKYKIAAEKLYLGYTTSKKDTIYLYYAAGNAVNGKHYDLALQYYNELKTIGYDGAQKQYVATNKASGLVENFNNQKQRDLSVKAGSHIKPEVKELPSRKSEIAKNIALIYISQGKNDKAMQAMTDAKKENPNDIALLQAEADMYYKLGDIEKYKLLMEQIVAKDPNNPDLLYNLGVSASKLGDNEKAFLYYKKALALKPNYTSAQINIAAVILNGEKELVDKMNKLGNSRADNKKYEKLQAERQSIYKKAIPYLEGALTQDSDNIEAVRTLMNIYYQLDDPKAEEYKAKLKTLEGGS